jgi:pimeloyl-ACP methyl ester carboxylesterase
MVTPSKLPLSFIEANGVRFAYLEEGEGPLVLLLHGFPDTAHTWDAVRPAVAAQGYRAVTPFMRGYYPTAVPRDARYDADTLGRDALALIEAFGVEKAVVVGHDWGAAAAYSAATLAPSSVSRLITVGIPHPASIRPTPSVLWMVRHFFTLKLPWALSHTRANNFAHIDELVKRWSPAWDVPSGETDVVKECFGHPGALDAALGYYRALRPTLPSSHRKRIAVPTISFAGLHDNVMPDAYDKARSWFTGGYEVVRVPGGHFMHREHPEPFIKELLRVIGAPGALHSP